MDNEGDTDIKKEDSDIQKHIRALSVKLVRFLSPDKPADVLIIKAHLICEYYLNQILIIKGFEANQIFGFSFFDKLQKAFDNNLAADKKIQDKLKALNKLRNKVGHELEYVLSESDVDTLGYLRGREYILNKYDYPEVRDLLKDTLEDFIVDLSLILFKMVSVEKMNNVSS